MTIVKKKTIMTLKNIYESPGKSKKSSNHFHQENYHSKIFTKITKIIVIITITYRIEPQSRPIGADWGWNKRRSPENYHHRNADNHHDDDDPDNNDDHDDDNNYNGDDDDVDDDEDDVDTGTLK